MRAAARHFKTSTSSLTLEQIAEVATINFSDERKEVLVSVRRKLRWIIGREREKHPIIPRDDQATTTEEAENAATSTGNSTTSSTKAKDPSDLQGLISWKLPIQLGMQIPPTTLRGHQHKDTNMMNYV